jgi:hypothetical protein
MLVARVEPKNGPSKEETQKTGGISRRSQAAVSSVQNGGCSLNRLRKQGIELPVKSRQGEARDLPGKPGQN